MTARNWYLTDSAVNCFVFARRYPASDESMERAERELKELMSRATFRKRDRYGRELWRSPRRTDSGL